MSCLIEETAQTITSGCGLTLRGIYEHGTSWNWRTASFYIHIL